MNHPRALSDKERLILAAKAGGIEGEYTERKCSCGRGRECKYDYWGIATKSGLWNPIISNSDAFSLMVELRLGVKAELFDLEEGVEVLSHQLKRTYCDCYDDDPEAATRQAIVDTAVVIAQKMDGIDEEHAT